MFVWIFNLIIESLIYVFYTGNFAGEILFSKDKIQWFLTVIKYFMYSRPLNFCIDPTSLSNFRTDIVKSDTGTSILYMKTSIFTISEIKKIPWFKIISPVTKEFLWEIVIVYYTAWLGAI